MKCNSLKTTVSFQLLRCRSFLRCMEL